MGLGASLKKQRDIRTEPFVGLGRLGGSRGPTGANHRMQNCFKCATPCRVGKDSFTEPGAIGPTFGVERRWTKCFDNQCSNRWIAGEEFVRTLIRIEQLR